MTTASTFATHARPGLPTTAVVEIVIPVYNEEEDLSESVHRLQAALSDTFPWASRITIADNASTDQTGLWPNASPQNSPRCTPSTWISRGGGGP